jgi:rhodanese-related sulfurtransferase
MARIEKKHYGLAIVGMLLGLFLIFLPKRETIKELTPEYLIEEMIEPTRYLTPEKVADMIIKRDPSIVLVDVRPVEEYDKFSLPGALNIPISKLADEENISLLKRKEYKFIFYSNDGVKADYAWMLTRVNGCEMGYVLNGGLNNWMERILIPKKPDETASEEEFELYNLRSGMRNYFLGLSRELEAENFVNVPKPARKNIPVIPKKKAKVEEEGC